MHIWPEIGLLEVLNLDDDNPSTLEDRAFHYHQFIKCGYAPDRYEVGDLGSLDGNVECACNRSLPSLGQIEGRLNDMLCTLLGGRYFG